MRSRQALSGLLSALLLACACDGRNQQPGKTNPSKAGGHHHEHVAPHGGTVIVLGDEAFHLEMIYDPAVGRVTLYVLDGHLENFIRLPAAGIVTSIALGETNRALVLTPVAQSATGETIGNTSQFGGAADWLKSSPELDGLISSIEVRGQQFTNVAFRIKADATANLKSNQ